MSLKKIVAAAAALLLTFSLFGCSGGQNQEKPDPTPLDTEYKSPNWTEGEFELSMLSDTFEVAHTDPLSGLPVYKLTNSAEGITDQNDLSYYENFYYHMNPFAAQAGKIVMRHYITGWGIRFTLLDLRTGETVELTGLRSANAEDVYGDYLYCSYDPDTSPAHRSTQIVRVALTEPYEIETLYSLSDGEIAGGVFFTGNIAVTCDGKKVLCQDTSRKIRVVDVESKTGSVFMTYSDDMQHIQASKTDPDLFSLINQSAGSTTARIVICDLSKGDYAAFESDSEYLETSAMFPNNFNLAHPIWDYNGHILSDCLGNTNDETGAYSFVSIDFKLAEDIGYVPAEGVTVSTWETARWNIHQTPAGQAYPEWYIGAAGHRQGGSAAYKNFTLFKMGADGAGIVSYDIGQLFGDSMPDPGQTAWLLPSGDAIIFSTGNTLTLGAGTYYSSDLYLMPLPESARAALRGE